MSADYTIIVQGQSFLLSRSQIEFDSPNLFTAYFFEDNNESNRSDLQMSRNPHLFSLIVEYLCGYTILPIHDDALPNRMSRETALINLRVDAEHYKLKKLIDLIESHKLAILPPQTIDLPKKPKVALVNSRLSSFFHFPGRVANWINLDPWYHYPSGYIESPLPIDLTKSFTIVCWYKAKSDQGWHTLISIDVPPAPHPLLYISISPEGDFRFELGVREGSGRLLSGPSGSRVRLNVWAHLAFVQHADESGRVSRRTLYINGKELISLEASIPIYNPAPSQTRLAIMRGSWDHQRTAGFIGQAEDVAVFQRALDLEEIEARASGVNVPADDGWPTTTAGDQQFVY